MLSDRPICNSFIYKPGVTNVILLLTINKSHFFQVFALASNALPINSVTWLVTMVMFSKQMTVDEVLGCNVTCHVEVIFRLEVAHTCNR